MELLTKYADQDMVNEKKINIIWCGSQYGWVRTWQFLERRFLTFSITHIYPVRVMELRNFTATITPIVGMGSLGAKISQIYTRWVLGDEVHDSEPQNVRSIKNDVKFNDHHAMPMDPIFVPNVMAQFLDIHFEIQLRGIRLTPVSKEHPKFFGYQKGDHDFGATSLRKQTNEDLDFLIAVTKIDGRCFSRGVNKFLRGEYPLFPPVPSVVNLEREGICTNDINLIRAPLTPNLVVPPHMILQAQMTLEVSMGLVGCKPKKRSDTFSRLYSVVHDSESIIAILKQITEINEEILQSEEKENLLTGFSLDAGNIVLLYVEGPSDHYILKVWEMTEDLYPKVKPVFSTSARYPSRLYPELLEAAMPFYILKMYVPMGVLLACPPVYARPALPLPTRSAILKLGRLISGKMRVAPCRFDMPTATELKSFRLELCVTPKPVMFVPPDESQKNVQPIMSLQRINWDK